MILEFRGVKPRLHESVIVMESAFVIGDVEMGAESSVWFGAVVRGDVNAVHIGEKTNLQDMVICHVTQGGWPVEVGSEVTVGHRVTLHSCKVGDRCLIGMGAVLLDEVEVGDECIIGAGSLLTPGTRIPPRTLALGAPAKPRREVTAAELQEFRDSARRYWEYAQGYQHLNLNRTA
ncbi:MAG: gamma carbonic anhydrase family protein [Deltaproteobacteria bacterium RBG_13_61_14]|nr:MAG: gamma carbonic anhydrase family protein [Deltaproteobacteria bacterium RBG_13_61_14]